VDDVDKRAKPRYPFHICKWLCFVYQQLWRLKRFEDRRRLLGVAVRASLLLSGGGCFFFYWSGHRHQRLRYGMGVVRLHLRRWNLQLVEWTPLRGPMLALRGWVVLHWWRRRNYAGMPAWLFLP
jgi:hypothetical protein